jgi:hypothetical protein
MFLRGPQASAPAAISRVPNGPAHLTTPDKPGLNAFALWPQPAGRVTETLGTAGERESMVADWSMVSDEHR